MVVGSMIVVAFQSVFFFVLNCIKIMFFYFF
jgi:hypothetical protein